MAEVDYTLRERQCTSCQILKLHNQSNFRFVSEVRSGKLYQYIKRSCLQCEYTKRVEYGRIHKDRQNALRKIKSSPEKYRNDNLRSKYGIGQEEYDQLLASQGGACAICGTTKTSYHKSGREISLTVDHNHATGEIRGLLCGSCNRGLGDFRDSIDSLAKAINYLGGQHG